MEWTTLKVLRSVYETARRSASLACRRATFLMRFARSIELRSLTELNPKHSRTHKKVAELLGLTEKNDLLQDAATRLREVLGCVT
jgi:hypothetical protein